MKYVEQRTSILTGDLLLVEGKGLASVLIRVFTGQQVSHVGMFVWIENGLFVAEMRGKGFSLEPASQRVIEELRKAHLYHGVADDRVHRDRKVVVDMIMRARAEKPDYSYFTLVKVWLSQIFKRKMPGALVCSTFVQHIWSMCGVPFAQTADPGDFMHACQSVVPVE